MKKLLFTFLSLVILLNHKSILSQSNQDDLNLRAYGVKIYVSDLKSAEEFYVDKIGFRIKSYHHESNIIELQNESSKLWLVQTEKINFSEYPDEAQTSLAIQVNDIHYTYEKWKTKGVEIISSIDTVGIGLAANFRDPFGNVLSIVQQTVGNVEKINGPRIYNYGYYFSDIPAARKLFVEKLKFGVRTEKYFPPALPLANWDNSFGFMLHMKKNLKPSDAKYKTDTKVSIVFATDDIGSAFNYFKEAGIEIHEKEPHENIFGKYFAFITKEGVVSELLQPIP